MDYKIAAPESLTRFENRFHISDYTARVRCSKKKERKKEKQMKKERKKERKGRGKKEWHESPAGSRGLDTWTLIREYARSRNPQV